MTIVRIEICRRDYRAAVPVVLAGATFTAAALPTPAAAQPLAPARELGEGEAYLARVEAFGGAVYAATGHAPDPAREPRTLVLPHPTREATLLAIGPGERVAVVRADDVTPPG